MFPDDSDVIKILDNVFLELHRPREEGGKNHTLKGIGKKIQFKSWQEQSIFLKISSFPSWLTCSYHLSC